jgi:hypothetical protein
MAILVTRFFSACRTPADIGQSAISVLRRLVKHVTRDNGIIATNVRKNTLRFRGSFTEPSLICSHLKVK